MLTVDQWLKHISQIHEKTMDLGLARIKAVAETLGLLPINVPVITVTGTNGKGSTVAALEQIYLAAGYSVGVFTSPHLWRINEEIRRNGVDVDDSALIAAFDEIEQARAEISLTVFEFATLAALILFRAAQLDVVILEVGLGGKTDAVNIVDADMAIITSIGIEHQAWLGDTRAEIAIEKAGIFRKNRPAICGDSSPPLELIEYSRQLPCPFYQINHEFNYQTRGAVWDWQGAFTKLSDLPIPSIELSNAASALMAVDLIQSRLPVTAQAVKTGLAHVALPGRYQIIEKPVLQIFDVCHNPHAALKLADKLRENQAQFRHTHAVFSMLKDKDIAETAACLNEIVTGWHIAPLATERGAALAQLQTALTQAGVTRQAYYYSTINDAHAQALNAAGARDRVVIFGSFHTVAATLKPIVRS